MVRLVGAERGNGCKISVVGILCRVFAVSGLFMVSGQFLLESAFVQSLKRAVRQQTIRRTNNKSRPVPTSASTCMETALAFSVVAFEDGACKGD